MPPADIDPPSSGRLANSTSSLSARMARPSLTDLRRKAHTRLNDRVDPVRNRHKPLSLLRLEARKVVEQYFEVECASLPKSERDRLIEDTLAEAPGLTPLEEHFRDTAVQEIMILTPGQVIARKGEAWLPTSVRFRDEEQLRAMLTRMAESGQGAIGGPATTGGFDVRLSNGFRALAVLPPEVMKLSPTALFSRLPTESQPDQTEVTGGAASVPSDRQSSVLTASAVMTAPAQRTPAPDSAVLPRPTSEYPRSGGLSSASTPDPIAKLRQRVTERIISQLAAAGVHDLGVLASHEMRKIVTAYVAEMSEDYQLGLDEPARERIVLEILAGMKR